MRALATHPAARGLVDDAAVLEIGGEALVLTHDILVEGVHWLPGQDMADVAWKLVATNMSDLAAKGAAPLGVLLGHMLGADDDRFAAGLAEALDHYGAPLLGGDTVSTPAGSARAFGLTALGRATHRPVPSRSGARPGDRLWLTGTLGAAMAGLEALQQETHDPAASLAYRRPTALIAQGQALAPRVTAMMDVSDGLLLDATRMARASGVTISITGTEIPIAVPEARRGAALRWGDDYQLLFTLPAGEIPPVPANMIGEVIPPGPAPLLLDAVPLSEADDLGYRHA